MRVHKKFYEKILVLQEKAPFKFSQIDITELIAEDIEGFGTFKFNLKKKTKDGIDFFK